MSMPTEIRADFDTVEIVDTDRIDWIASPAGGVDRKPLDRIGGEVARATSLVRYAPGSDFPTHVHSGGEEFLVVEGIFSDEHGDFSPGTYVRNPVGTSHAPSSKDGCVILVKLWQFQGGDTAPVTIDTMSADWQSSGQGVECLPLHRFGEEEVSMLRLTEGGSHQIPGEAGGTELYVMSGETEANGAPVPQSGWARFPAGEAVTLSAPGAATLYLKTGHLKGPISGPATGAGS
ncbi:cupin domain-containing protein [uncultured Hoeflea sp.]|uniref:cupin domain-containing protein n=1 Tax=uncultured Hoeflea sp. TaxID=538666 RepID=UPI0026036154|nr:cupin domain-containing protein [uncultured Hoeflea sp.]